LKKMIITLVFEKNANFFAKNGRKSHKIVIITSTPGRTQWKRLTSIKRINPTGDRRIGRGRIRAQFPLRPWPRDQHGRPRPPGRRCGWGCCCLSSRPAVVEVLVVVVVVAAAVVVEVFAVLVVVQVSVLFVVVTEVNLIGGKRESLYSIDLE
jgi:hypothetical protein